MEGRITSASNPKLKLWKEAKRGKGLWTECWLPEGIRLCQEAFQSLEQTGEWGRLRGMLVSDSAWKQQAVQQLCAGVRAQGCEPIGVSDALFQKIADTVHPQGVCMALDPPASQAVLQTGSRILVLERVQDPGNLGACCRSADALGFDALILTAGGVKPNNSKALRAGMGAFFHIPVLVIPEAEQTFALLEETGYQVLVADLQANVWPTDQIQQYRTQSKLAVWIGNEGAGISALARARATAAIRLPMDQRAESLNAACAASILCYLFSPLSGGKEGSACKL